jgi:hypothetical protein
MRRRIVEHRPERQIIAKLGQLAPLRLFQAGKERPDAIGREHGIAERVLHVLVARQHPAADAVAPMHGITLHQRMQRREGIADHRRLHRIEADEQIHRLASSSPCLDTMKYHAAQAAAVRS